MCVCLFVELVNVWNANCCVRLFCCVCKMVIFCCVCRFWLSVSPLMEIFRNFFMCTDKKGAKKIWKETDHGWWRYYSVIQLLCIKHQGGGTCWWRYSLTFFVGFVQSSKQELSKVVRDEEICESASASWLCDYINKMLNIHNEHHLLGPLAEQRMDLVFSVQSTRVIYTNENFPAELMLSSGVPRLRSTIQGWMRAVLGLDPKYGWVQLTFCRVSSTVRNT